MTNDQSDLTGGGANVRSARDDEPSALSVHRPSPDKLYGRDASFISKLTTGTGAFNILGPRKIYYVVSSTLVIASLLLIIFRGFHFGIDFAGGTTLIFQPNPGESISTTEVAQVVTSATGIEPDSVQTVGNQIQVSSATLSVDQVVAAKGALNSAYAPSGGVSNSAVSETWGSEISQRALIAVIVFLIAVAIFLWIRYEKRVAFGAVLSVVHDLIVTAGIYSLSGFEVTPATVIGLLTILGFSLYDTVVVYDKVQENTKGLTSLTRRTYPEAANLAINQTLMRSINTSSDRAAAGGRPAGRRRGDPWLGDAEGPVPGHADRHVDRRLFVGLPGRSGGRRPQAARPADQGAHRAGAGQAEGRGPGRGRRRRPDRSGTRGGTAQQEAEGGEARQGGCVDRWLRPTETRSPRRPRWPRQPRRWPPRT